MKKVLLLSAALAFPGLSHAAPLKCLVVGDSLGVGIGQYLPECETHATVGISAARLDDSFSPPAAELTIISLGSNPGPETQAHLLHLREEVQGPAIWIIPADQNRAVVMSVSSDFHDSTLDARSVGAGPGHIHPAASGYKELAARIKDSENNAG
jgi:hypothetical protein